MSGYTTTDIRNIALVGASGSGKTTLIEVLSVAAKRIAQRGHVGKGTTLGDYLPQERALQHSLKAAFVDVDHGGVHLNLIDTPGSPDFVGRALAAKEARGQVSNCSIRARIIRPTVARCDWKCSAISR